MVTRPAMERSRVDLPEPDALISPIISPERTSSETASRARRSWKVLLTFRTERTAAEFMSGGDPSSSGRRAQERRRFHHGGRDGFMTWPGGGGPERGAAGSAGGRGRIMGVLNLTSLIFALHPPSRSLFARVPADPMS